MNQSYGCNICYNNPCTCSCGCEPTYPPVACQPIEPVPTITVEGLLKVIATKCDEETCEIIQFEVALLYTLMGIEHPGPEHPGHPDHPDLPVIPGQPPVEPPVLPGPAFQLVKNMVDSLQGDLKKKYPSALLLKKELYALWKCMADKQTHHGDWDKNFTYREVISTEERCLLDGELDYAPKKIKVTTPVDVGSTVFNVIEGKKCLFESLVDNNTTEPTKLSVLQGKWINYCDLKEVIDCVLPRTIITDCKEKCDDPNHDGVHEGKKLCDRVHDLEDCCIEVKGEEIKGLTCESKKLTLTKANGHKLQLPISQCVPPPFSWIKNFSFSYQFFPSQDADPHFSLLGEVTVPKDGKYHISGNVWVKEECPTSSVGYNADCFIAIQGGKTLVQEWSGEHGPVTNDGNSVVSYVTNINNYHSLGPVFKAAAGFGKTLQLHAGDKIRFDAGQQQHGNGTAFIQFDVTGGISYVGV